MEYVNHCNVKNDSHTCTCRVILIVWKRIEILAGSAARHLPVAPADANIYSTHWASPQRRPAPSATPRNLEGKWVVLAKKAGNLSSRNSLAIHLSYESTNILNTSHCHFPSPPHSTTATWLGCLRQVHSRFTTTATQLPKRHSTWIVTRTWKSRRNLRIHSLGPGKMMAS